MKSILLKNVSRPLTWTSTCTFQKIVVESNGHSKQEAKNRSAAQMIVLLANSGPQNRLKPVEVKPIEGSTLQAIDDNINDSNTEDDTDDDDDIKNFFLPH